MTRDGEIHGKRQAHRRRTCVCDQIGLDGFLPLVFVLLKMVRVKSGQSTRRNYHQTKRFDSSNTIQIGQHGYFVTFCSTKESFVRNEIYNLLNRFAEQLFGAEFSDEKGGNDEGEVDLDDLDSALESEKSKLNESKKRRTRRFQIVKSGTNHSFFVVTTLPVASINKLVESIFNTSIDLKEQHSRYVERLLPIAFVCKAYEDDLRRLIIKEEFCAQILLLLADSDPSLDTIWFDVQARKSNNTQLKSSQLEEIVINDLTSRKPEDFNGRSFRRDYKKPYVNILLHVIKNLILISVVRNYDLFKKYNLASINLTTVTAGEQPPPAQQKITFEDDEEEQLEAK